MRRPSASTSTTPAVAPPWSTDPASVPAPAPVSDPAPVRNPAPIPGSAPVPDPAAASDPAAVPGSTAETATPSKIATPRATSMDRRPATSSGSSRLAMVAASNTVTREPSPAKASAISKPIGPPPRISRCSGCCGRSNRVSLVRNGTRSRPGIGGTAARLPAATTMRRAVMRRPSTSSASGATNRACAAQHGGAERPEARLGIRRRDRGDRALDMRAHRIPVDRGLRHAQPEPAGTADRLGGVGRGEQAPCWERSRC